MKLRILSFSGESFSSSNVVSVTLTTAVGEITILDNHTPLVTSIKPSTMYVVYVDDKGTKKREDFAIGKGVVEVSDNNTKIMADMLVDADKIDIESAEKARQKAIELMEKFKNAKDKVDMEKYIEAEDLLLKSIAQLKLYDTLK